MVFGSQRPSNKTRCSPQASMSISLAQESKALGDRHAVGLTVDSRWLEYGFRVIHGGFPSCFGFGIRGRSCPNFMASTTRCRAVDQSALRVAPRRVP